MKQGKNCDLDTEIISGNIFIRPVKLLNKGDFVQGHKHNFDHTTIVFKGSILIKQNNGKEQNFYSPGNPNKQSDDSSHALICKDTEHLITALEDNTIFWCVYSHRTPQGEVSLENTGWLNNSYTEKI